MPASTLRPIGRAILLAATVLVAAPADDAVAQVAGARSVAVPSAMLELRQRQEQLFQQLLREPENLDLMFEYATVSIGLREFEPAISTLERMLIYRQDLPRVRLELGAAYFSLGSYEVAKLYFEQVLADGSVPDDVRARVERYLAEIATRSRTHQLSVVLSAGLTHSTNATLGPESDQILLNGTLATVNAGREESDFGVRALVAATHTWDMQQPDEDFWRTDLTYFSLTYFDTNAGDVQFGRIRTGPRLSLDADQFGPKLRPYVEAQYLTSNERGLFAAFGGGAEYTHAISPEFTVFGDYGMRYRNYFRQEFTDEDAYNIYGQTGVAYVPMRDLVVRGTSIVEVDSADQDFNSNLELGLRLSGDFQYEPPVAGLDQKWVLSTYSEVRHRMFEANEPIIGANCCRRDWDLRSGISHFFAIKDGFGVKLDVEALARQSNIRNFDVSNMSTTLSLQYRM